MAELDVCREDELPPGTVKVVGVGGRWIAIFNCRGRFHAIEDRCSHDDGPLADGDLDEQSCVVVCPRHGASFDLNTGNPLTLPATEAVDIFPVTVADGVVRISVD